jgi:hypothetical protein
MSDTPEEDIQAYKNCLHPAVRAAYEEEERIVAAHIRHNVEAGQSWIQQALTWVPYIDAVFEEDTGDAAAVSDINIIGRQNLVISKIEAALGESLAEDTRQGIRQDVRDIWGL